MNGFKASVSPSKKANQEQSRGGGTSLVGPFGAFLLVFSLVSNIVFFWSAQSSGNLLYGLASSCHTDNDSASSFSDAPVMSESSSVQEASDDAGGTTSNSSICPAALKLFDHKSLEEMIQKAHYFHQQGGNLISIGRFMDRATENTVDKLDLKFEFKDKTFSDENEGGGAIENLHKYFKTRDVPRGGYGQPLPGNYVGLNARAEGPLYEQRYLNVIEPDTAERFKVAIGKVGPKCLHEIHFAKDSYEGKVFCVPPDHHKALGSNIRGSSEKNFSEEEECNIFSVGSNDQWGFEEEVVKELPECVTHTFDCTLKDNAPRLKPASDSVRFYPYCIGGDHNVGSKERFLPYGDMWKKANITAPPKMLKIDVEGFEFDVIPAMLRNSPPEIWPEQIAIEIHWATRMVSAPSVLRTISTAEIALLFGHLFIQGGYLPVKAKYFDPDCSSCLEVLFVRVRCD